MFDGCHGRLDSCVCTFSCSLRVLLSETLHWFRIANGSQSRLPDRLDSGSGPIHVHNSFVLFWTNSENYFGCRTGFVDVSAGFMISLKGTKANPRLSAGKIATFACGLVVWSDTFVAVVVVVILGFVYMTHLSGENKLR